MRRLWHTHHYREGVLAQFCYVGAQIMCWTFIIQYGTRLLMAEGDYTALEHTIGGLLGIDTSGAMTEKNAEVLSQGYNIIAMGSHCIGRFRALTCSNTSNRAISCAFSAHSLPSSSLEP